MSAQTALNPRFFKPTVLQKTAGRGRRLFVKHLQRVLVKTQGTFDMSGEERQTTMKDVTIIRQGYSMLRRDRELIEELRLRAWKNGVLLNRSEVVRAGIAALATLDTGTFIALSEEVPKLKPGRPEATDTDTVLEGALSEKS